MGKTAFRLMVTGVASLLMTVTFIGFGYGGRSDIFMRGELSSKHSGLGKKCGTCHNPWRGVKDEKCTECHNKLAAHVPDSAAPEKVALLAKSKCAGCHVEHGGVNHNIRSVSAKACQQCHKFGTHPEVKPPTAKSVYPHGIHISKPIGMEKCYLCHTTDDETGKLVMDPFVKDGSICVGCHPGKYSTPPDIHEHPFIKNTGFKHSSHAEAKIECEECHGNLFKLTTDGLEPLPSVSSCMQCHGKTSGTFACVKCHKFHVPSA